MVEKWLKRAGASPKRVWKLGKEEHQTGANTEEIRLKFFL